MLTVMTALLMLAGAPEPTPTAPLQVVERHFPPSVPRPIAPDEVVRRLRLVAADLNALQIFGGPYGLLVKTGGTNCVGYSCDILCVGQGAAQQQWDVLVDADGPVARAAWDGPLATIVSRPCEIVPPSTTTPPVVCPECPPTDFLSKRIAELDEALQHTKEDLAIVLSDREALQEANAVLHDRINRTTCDVRPKWTRIFGARCSVQIP